MARAGLTQEVGEISNIVLVGFMGVGKSAVGQLVAERMGMAFVDCDTVITKNARRSIADIFAREGEAGFRQRERAAIRKLSAGRGQVIATGGGAFLDPENVSALRRSGSLICLTARPEVIWERVRHGNARPLLQVPNPPAQIEELLAARASCYAQADHTIDTSETTPAQVAAGVLAWMRLVRVELGERSYDIVVEPDALAGIGEEVAACGPFSRAVVITAPVLAETWGVAAVDDLCAHGIPADMLVIPPGEKQKSLARAGRICERMVELGADRRSVVVALGGGVIGDLSGFVAATYMRGIAMVQAPTTLLAQVDSSLGGKVAVNLPQGKNLVGAFHQPRLVLIDPVVLRTLPRRELRGGMAEVIKSGVIADARLFTYLEDHRRELLRREPFALRHVIRGCCEIKAAVVGQDEREETGCRATLNFGHTIGHAIESLGAGAYRHGEAVAIGMVAAGRLAVATGRWSAEEQGRMAALLENVGLPVRARGQAPADILARMRADKKNVAGRLHLVLPTRLGHVELVTDVDEDALMRVLEEICEEDR